LETVKKFRSTAIHLLQPLLSCNRRYFLSVAEHIVEHVGVEYGFDSHQIDTHKPSPASNRVKAIAQQAKVWTRRLLCGNFELSSLFSHDELPCCSVGEEELEKFLTLIDQLATAELVPLLELSPCVSFIGSR